MSKRKLNAIDDDDNILRWMVFTHEATLHMNGHVKTHSCRIWGQKRRHMTFTRTLEIPQKLMWFVAKCKMLKTLTCHLPGFVTKMCPSANLWNWTRRKCAILFQEEGDPSHFTSYNPYPTAFPYGNGMVLHFYQQQESSTTKTVHKVINKRLKTYV